MRLKEKEKENFQILKNKHIRKWMYRLLEKA